MKTCRTYGGTILKIITYLLNAVLTIVVLVFLVTAGISFFSAPDAGGLFGYKGYTIVSGSMEPTLSVGDFIFVELAPYKTIEEKDILTFLSNGEVVTHRVAEKTEAGLITKGDANTIEDQGITTKETYIGKLKTVVPYFGYVIIFLQKPIIFASLVALIGLYFIYSYYRSPRESESAENRIE